MDNSASASYWFETSEIISPACMAGARKGRGSGKADTRAKRGESAQSATEAREKEAPEATLINMKI